jgi:broad specificity phosphatase PhoE
MRLLLIRHAEPDPSPDWRGDPPLNATGRAQAEHLAEALRDSALDRVVCSALQRAVETARPLAAAVGAPLVVEPELKEIEMGTLWRWGPEQQREWGRVVAQWGAGRTDVRLPEGESLDEVAVRVRPVVARHVADGGGGDIAIVAHGVVNNVILTTLCPELLSSLGKDLGISHTGIWELEGSGSTFHTLRRNDTRHLAALRD